MVGRLVGVAAVKVIKIYLEYISVQCHFLKLKIFGKKTGMSPNITS